MPKNKFSSWFQGAVFRMYRILVHPVSLAAMPPLLLVSYKAYGEVALLAAAMSFPFLGLFLWSATYNQMSFVKGRPVTQGLKQQGDFVDLAQEIFEDLPATGMKSAVFSIEVDDHEACFENYGHSGAEKVARTLGNRLVAVMRDDDAIAQTGDFSFAICLAAVRQLDLEICLQLAGRMQSAIEEPITVDGMTVYVTACVGFAQFEKGAAKSAQSWRDAAGIALVHARRNGSGSIRAFSQEMKHKSQAKTELRQELAAALSNGQIRPWFQPQISTDTGRVTGFEALARWHHPTKGLIPPSEFLKTIEQSGLLERLAEVMMFHAFTALTTWDRCGVRVPQVGVNFAGPELNNPNLADKIVWELDRFNLSANRLAVEVLETVISSAPDDVVSRNIKKLSELGCRIDLDDFGTGHTSITSLRRFAVNRIKIDRSFVMKSDRDPEQQRMISAILTMAERLNIETLAEGVETVGEHALLAQLGCDHVQGFGIGKPMPFEETIDWIAAHNAKLQSAEQIMGNKLR